MSHVTHSQERRLTRRSFVAAALLAGACRKRLPPEEQVRRAIAAAEHAATEKDLSALGDFVSPAYKDAEQNDRAAVMGVLRLQFMRYPAIYLLLRIVSVEVPAPREARAVVLAAMASVPIHGPEELPRLAADLYRFELQLRDDEGKGRWQVVGATWRPVELGEFAR